MFKKGQLVKIKDFGYYGVVERISDKFKGLYYVNSCDWPFGMWFRENELIHIGNNFKFKGAK